MAIMTSNSFPKSRVAQAITWFNTIQKQQTDDWKRIYKTMSSDSAYEQAISFPGFGLMQQKEETEYVRWDETGQGFIKNYYNLMWSLGFRLGMVAQKVDKNARILQRLSEALSVSASETQRYLAFQPFVNAFSTAQGDGKALCATDHPAEATGGGTNANKPSTDVRLSETAFSDARITLRRWKTGRNVLMNVDTDTLICGPEDMDEAVRLLQSDLRPGDATNAVNVINKRGYFPGGVIEVPYITTNTWFILTDQKTNGFKHYELFPLTFKQDEITGMLVDCYLAFMAGSFGCDHWTAIYGSSGA